MPIRLFHNPRCSKSREALALLRERGVEPDVVEYLKQPPTANMFSAQKTPSWKTNWPISMRCSSGSAWSRAS